MNIRPQPQKSEEDVLRTSPHDRQGGFTPREMVNFLKPGHTLLQMSAAICDEPPSPPLCSVLSPHWDQPPPAPSGKSPSKIFQLPLLYWCWQKAKFHQYRLILFIAVASVGTKKVYPWRFSSCGRTWSHTIDVSTPWLQKAGMLPRCSFWNSN